MATSKAKTEEMASSGWEENRDCQDTMGGLYQPSAQQTLLLKFSVETSLIKSKTHPITSLWPQQVKCRKVSELVPGKMRHSKHLVEHAVQSAVVAIGRWSDGWSHDCFLHFSG